MELLGSKKTSGLDGLMKAGVALLDSDEQIRQLCDRIQQHGEKHPLGRKIALFSGVDLKRFFEYAITKGVNFLQVNLDQLVEQFKKEA